MHPLPLIEPHCAAARLGSLYMDTTETHLILLTIILIGDFRFGNIQK